MLQIINNSQLYKPLNEFNPLYRSNTMLFFVIIVQLPSHVRLCDPMNHSIPGFPVLQGLLDFAQVHVH